MITLSPKRLFLIDALGALISTILLGVILPYFKEFIGMPKGILWVLAAIALSLFLYSHNGYKKFPQKWSYYLRGIVVANFLYCMLTTSAVVYFWPELKPLGRLYFLGELVLVMGLVVIEFKMISKRNKMHNCE